MALDNTVFAPFGSAAYYSSQTGAFVLTLGGAFPEISFTSFVADNPEYNQKRLNWEMSYVDGTDYTDDYNGASTPSQQAEYGDAAYYDAPEPEVVLTAFCSGISQGLPIGFRGEESLVSVVEYHGERFEPNSAYFVQRRRGKDSYSRTESIVFFIADAIVQSLNGSEWWLQYNPDEVHPSMFDDENAYKYTFESIRDLCSLSPVISSLLMADDVTINLNTTDKELLISKGGESGGCMYSSYDSWYDILVGILDAVLMLYQGHGVVINY